MNIIVFALVGIAAGWIAGQLMKGSGFGLLGNLIIGLVGAFIGGFIFGLLGVAINGLLGALVASVIGAVVLLAAVGYLKK